MWWFVHCNVVTHVEWEEMVSVHVMVESQQLDERGCVDSSVDSRAATAAARVWLECVLLDERAEWCDE